MFAPEDQQQINTFSKINTRFQNIKSKSEELQVRVNNLNSPFEANALILLQQEKEALDDLATELELADEDDLVLQVYSCIHKSY